MRPCFLSLGLSLCTVLALVGSTISSNVGHAASIDPSPLRDLHFSPGSTGSPALRIFEARMRPKSRAPACLPQGTSCYLIGWWEFCSLSCTFIKVQDYWKYVCN